MLLLVDGCGIVCCNDMVMCLIYGLNYIVDGDDIMIVQGEGVVCDGYKMVCGVVLVVSWMVGSDGN